MLHDDAAAALLEQAFACIGTIASEAAGTASGAGSRYGDDPKAACEVICGLADAVRSLPTVSGHPELGPLEKARYNALAQWDERYFSGHSPLHSLIQLLAVLA
jgi:hypothetical protein